MKHQSDGPGWANFELRRNLIGRIHWWVAAVVLATCCCLPASGRLSFAQPTEPALTDGEGLEDELPADPTPDGGASQPSANGGSSPLRMLKDGGLVGILIGLLSMVSVAFIVEHFISIRKTVLLPPDLAEELEQLIQQGQLDQASELCTQTPQRSLLAEVVQAGLERFRASQFGFAEYKAAVEEAGEDQTGRLYRKTEVLGVIGSIAPMLGLTGTVLGMIEAFNKIASSGGAARPDELAGGIGKALVTTLLGLIVAIPTMIAFSYFRNRIDSIVAEAGKRVEQIMMPLGRRKQ